MTPWANQRGPGADDHSERFIEQLPKRPTSEESVLWSYFHEACPRILYHYTRQPSLLGIFESQRLWFTDIQYFNDSQEYRYALEMATREIESIDRSSKPEVMRRLARSILHDLRRSKLQSFFVFCCSQNGDLLSQWRSYASPGPGYAIGFDSAYLQRLAEGGTFGRCIYKQSEQQRFIAQFIDVFFRDLLSYFPHFERGEINADLFVAKKKRFLSLFLRYAPFIKNASFEEEAEWRVVIPAKSFKLSDVQFRDGRMTLIPFVQVFHPDLKLLPQVKRVIVKPNPHDEIARHAVSRFFDSKGIEDVVVSPSEIPYRETF